MIVFVICFLLYGMLENRNYLIFNEIVLSVGCHEHLEIKYCAVNQFYINQIIVFHPFDNQSASIGQSPFRFQMSY